MSKIKLTGNASGTGTLTIAAPNTNTDRTFNLPDEDGTVLTKTSGEDVSFYDATGTTAKFFWDASAESLGIGTSSPANTLHVEKSGSTVATFRTSNNNSVGGIELAGKNSGGTAAPFYLQAGTSSELLFLQGSGATERMRIDSSGNLLVGNTSYNSTNNGILCSANGRLYATVDGFEPAQFNRRTSNGNIVTFQKDAVTVGSISVTGSATAYNTSSDYRLKTDVQPMVNATERLKALKPVNFEWISSGERVDGFLAHELQEVIPEAATGTKDAMRTEEYEVTPAVLDDNGNVVTEAVMGEREVPDYQGIDQSKLVPLLVATIQEQQAAIEALTARVDALEAV